MNPLVVRNIIRWLVLVLGDIFVVSRLNFSVYAVPQIYPLFILMLPVRTSRNWVIVLAFLTGLLVDVFLNTGGIHAASATFLGLLRPFIATFFVSSEDEENNITPSLRSMGAGTFLLYSAMLIVPHHAFYFLVEIFKTGPYLMILLKTAFSSIISLLLYYFLLTLFQGKYK
jgi:rod shape-determining protein MreD